MPVAVDPKSACHCVSACHGDCFTIVECHRVPQAAQPPATRPWNGPSATRGPMSWSAGTQPSPPRQVPCRGLDLAGPGNLPGSEACRSPGPAEAHIAPRRVSCDATLSLERPSRQAPLAGVLTLWLGRPGKLLLPGPCLLGPASSSCRGLVLIFCLAYFVLECLVFSWPQKGAVEPLGAPTASLAAAGYNCPCTSSGY